MRLVHLKNRWNRPIPITLYHEHYCANGGKCQCKREEYDYSHHDKKTGKIGYARGTRILPKSVSIGPKQSINGLNDAILKVPGVKGMIQRNLLSLAYNEPPLVAVSPVAKGAPPVDDGSGEVERQRRRGRRRSSPEELTSSEE